MGVSPEGAGMLYRYILFPVAIIGFIIALSGGFGDDSEIMIIVSIACAVMGFFGPKIFGK